MPPVTDFRAWVAGLPDDPLLAVTLLAEAGIEDTVGRQMIANVAMTRLAIAKAHEERYRTAYWWGTTVREIILKPWQFTCWQGDHAHLMAQPHSPLWAEALTIARQALAGRLPDLTHGATHYLNPRLVTGALPPWATPGHLVAVHLDHRFYRAI